MPTNVTAEYIAAEKEYSKAKTVEEKIAALERMYREAPKHKGGENLRKDIRTKLAKFREKQKKEAERKTKGKGIVIKKEGAATICLVGPPNSGKTLLLNKLTNRKFLVADYNFTTKMPQVGIAKYKGLKLQLIELPAIIEDYALKGKGPLFFSVIRNADLVVILTDIADLDILFKEFEKARIKLNEKLTEEDKEEDFISLNAFIVINKADIIDVDNVHKELCKYYNLNLFRMSALNDNDIERLKDEIWKHLGLIKIYPKEPSKKVSKDEPLYLEKGATIKDMAVHIHKDFIRKFRFARVWGSSKFARQQVGLNYKLEDDDIVEIHLK